MSAASGLGNMSVYEVPVAFGVGDVIYSIFERKSEVSRRMTNNIMKENTIRLTLFSPDPGHSLHQ